MDRRDQRLSQLRDLYDVYWSQEGFNPRQTLLPSLAEILAAEVSPADECLDVGCGPGGGPAAWLADHAGSYTGVDVSKPAVDAARAAGLDVRHIDDASHLPFADARFDLAVCVEVLEHLLDPGAAAAEILRVLRPGGRLIATVPNVAYWRRRADMARLGRWNPLGDSESAHRPWRDPHLRFFGRSNLEDMLRSAGFDPVVTGGHGGSWLADVPGVRRAMRRQDPGPVYRRLVRAAPSLFAHHLHARAARPSAPPGPR